MDYKKWIIIYFLVAVASFTLTYFDVIKFNISPDFITERDRFIPELEKKHIKEYVLIYIGSSRCTYSNDPKIYRAVKDIKYQLSNISKENNAGFHSIGISAELNPNEGIQHLDNFGNFNEIISGAGWNSTGVVNYLQKYSQDYATPSIIVTEKVYQDSTFRYLESEDLLFSVSGQLRILQIQKKDLEFVE